tara:strand:+ start:642 stop:1541 length:900 start_codon:yes stop_codon:yes gene_type:complete
MGILGKGGIIKEILISDKIVSNFLSGKSYNDENFPVSSILIKKKIRDYIRKFYFFARTADDIADHKSKKKHTKAKILKIFDTIIEKNMRSDVTVLNELIDVFEELKIGRAHARNLLKAFILDTNKQRYKNWRELLNYCKFSANPVGRYVIDISYKIEKQGEDNINQVYFASDNLCSALQILNHMQDCQKDYLEMNRVYIPEELFKKYSSSISDLKLKESSNNFKNLKNEIINKVEEMLKNSKCGLKLIKISRLRKETLIIFYIAKKLCYLLRKNDPLKKKVKLSRIDLIFCFLKGIIEI